MTTPSESSKPARLSRSFRERNRTSRKFREQYAKLPKSIQALTRTSAERFDRNPDAPSFRHHMLGEDGRGSHEPQSMSVSITMRYRAIYVMQDGVRVWYWIGTHADYDTFTGGKR